MENLKKSNDQIIAEKKEIISAISGLSLNYVEDRGCEILEFIRTTAPKDYFGRTGNKSNSFYSLFNTIEDMCKKGYINLFYEFRTFNQDATEFTVGGFRTDKELRAYFEKNA